MYLEDISELILGRRNKQNAHASTINVKGAIKVHHPVLRAGGSDGLLDLDPLSDEINKRLRLDCRPASEFNGIGAELNNPLNDVAIGFFVAKNVPQGKLSDHGDLVVFEVMPELARCNQNCI